MSKLQIGMTEDELKRMYYILSKASVSFQLKGGKRFRTYRATIIRIVEDYAKEHGLINDNGEVVNSINNCDEDREYFETMIRAVEKEPTAGASKTLWEMVLKMNPEYRAPKEFATKALVIEAKRLLEAV